MCVYMMLTTLILGFISIFSPADATPENNKAALLTPISFNENGSKPEINQDNEEDEEQNLDNGAGNKIDDAKNGVILSVGYKDQQSSQNKNSSEENSDEEAAKFDLVSDKKDNDITDSNTNPDYMMLDALAMNIQSDLYSNTAKEVASINHLK